MKTIKTITLSMVFLFGLTAMPLKPLDKSSEKTVVQECGLAYSACDKAYPGSANFSSFANCMGNNGC